MILFLRNLAVACISIMVLVGMMAAGVMIWFILLVAVVLVLGYIALRKAGIINPPRKYGRPNAENPFETEIIEAEYTVISETEKQIPKDRV